MIRLFNTLTKKKEILKKPFFKSLKLFVCGPTVYNYLTIGNFRTILFFDLLVRYLKSRGYKITYLQNITDIDDKIIEKANQENTTWEKISKEYEDKFMEDIRALNIQVDHFARATNYIDEIIKQIKVLIKKGHVYRIEKDGWYFDITSFADYGKLARRTAEQADDAVSRIDNSKNKKNAGDFAVWKFSKEGEPVWQTELGAGRPGWHIEDTAISEHYFGQQYDLHGGAIDLIFPHHEAEIALQESASGKKPFVRHWIHGGFLQVDGKRMGKSLGNFVTANDVLKKYSANTIRFFFFTHHYRMGVNFTDKHMQTAKKNIQEIGAFLTRLNMIKMTRGKNKIDVKVFKKRFHGALEDDFNSPQATAVLFDLMNQTNKVLWRISKSNAQEISNFLNEILSLLGFRNIMPVIPNHIKEFMAQRELLRSDKQFTQADALRKKIEAVGYVVEDTPVGPLLLPKD